MELFIASVNDPGRAQQLAIAIAGRGAFRRFTDSQQALAYYLRLARSRIVVLVDELEQRKLVKRHPSPTDRRAHALQLTAKGHQLLQQIIDASRQHEDELCEPLDADERTQLTGLLQRLAAQL